MALIKKTKKKNLKLIPDLLYLKKKTRQNHNQSIEQWRGIQCDPPNFGVLTSGTKFINANSVDMRVNTS